VKLQLEIPKLLAKHDPALQPFDVYRFVGLLLL